jgi:hypothetical protein
VNASAVSADWRKGKFVSVKKTNICSKSIPKVDQTRHEEKIRHMSLPAVSATLIRPVGEGLRKKRPFFTRAFLRFSIFFIR